MAAMLTVRSRPPLAVDRSPPSGRLLTVRLP
jgi:hypothetical protein